MDPFVEHVARNIRSRKLLDRRERILVAVSGGVDSMVLLEVLHGLASEFGWNLIVAHFNHRLRSRASGWDERLVRRRSRELELPCLCGAGEVRREAKRRGISIEMAARDLRHQFLAVTAQNCGCRVVALGHHADDQAEGILVRLLRGTSAEGLGGMGWSSPSPWADDVEIVRPLLDVPKAELVGFAAQNHLSFRTDASNACVDHLRNRIRHDLLPRLERDYQPGLRGVLTRLAVLLADEAEFVAQTARRWRSSRRLSGFNRLSRAVQRQVLVQEVIAAGFQPDFRLIERLRAEPGKRVPVTGGRLVSGDGSGRVKIETKGSLEFQRNEMRHFLKGRAGRLHFSDLEVRWTKTSKARRFGAREIPGRSVPGEESFDADKVGQVIILRHWRPGDRFRPIGMRRAVKLQDLFTNAKVSAVERRSRVVAVAESGLIFWVEGLRMSESFKLDISTQFVLEWGWHRV